MAGSPLSPAEIEQRRNAARARWAAGAVGAAAGVAAAHVGLRVQRKAVIGKLKAAQAETIKPEIARHHRRAVRLAAQEAAAKKAIKRTWPVPAMRAALRRDQKAMHRALHTLPQEWDDFLGQSRPVDSFAEGTILRDIRHKQGEIDALADAKPPSVHHRGPSVVRAARAHTRTIKTGSSLRTLNERDAKVLAALQVKHEGIRTALSEALEGAVAEGRHDDADDIARSLHHHGDFKPPARFLREEVREAEVRPEAGKVSLRGSAKVRTQGVPNDAGLRSIRRDLDSRIGHFFTDRNFNETMRHAAVMGAGRAAFEASRANVLRFVPRGRAARLGTLGVGAVLGGLGGYFAARSRKVEKLAKAEDSGDEGLNLDGATPTEATDTPADAAKVPADTMMERLAEMFRKWKGDAADLAGLRGASLHTTMLTDLGYALDPITIAARGGAEAPMEVVEQQEDGTPRTLSYSLLVRNQKVEDFIAAYRKDRIVELANEQRDAIKALLIQAAKEGASPDEMARRIRQTVGLTTTQAGHVLSYRRALELGDPNALNRALRDRRYDKTVIKAMATGQGLTPEQIDTMTDAYQRRYLAYRAMTIARTEGVMAANNGHMAAVESLAGEDPDFTIVKTWLATDDERTRHDHRALDGVRVIGLHTPFTVQHPTGEIDSILWPHDQDAPARQVINCRCTLKTQVVPRRLVAAMGPDAVDYPSDPEETPERVDG